WPDGLLLFVGVDLVAEEQQAVGPLRLVALEELGVRPEGVDPLPYDGPRPLATELRRLGPAEAARPEDEADEALVVARADHRTGPPVVGRPDQRAVESNVVRVDRAGLEVVDE